MFSFVFQYLKTYVFRHTSIRNRNKKYLPDFSFSNSSKFSAPFDPSIDGYSYEWKYKVKSVSGSTELANYGLVVLKFFWSYMVPRICVPIMFFQLVVGNIL